MTDNPNYSYISTLRTPDGGTHYVKDAEAREAITSAENRLERSEEEIGEIKTAIKGGTHFIGVTTTALTDGATTNPVTVDGSSITAKTGDFTIYTKTVDGTEIGVEFIWTGSKWSELGSVGKLKALAYKDSASGKVTPGGTVAAPKITVTPTKSSISHLGVAVVEDTETLAFSVTNKDVMTAVAVSAAAPAFTGKETTVTVS